VACVWEQQVGTETTQRVIPDAHADLLTYGDGRVEVTGLHDRVALPHLPAGTHVRGVRLRPQAVAVAFRIDASSLVNRTVALEDLLGSRSARQLADSRRVDSWITSLLPSRRTTQALRLLSSHTVEQTAARCEVSSRQLHRSLVLETGLSPKKLQRVLRMQAFLAAAEAGQGLAAAATAAGYFDQPHLSRDLQALAGATPGQLLRERAQPAG
jgi:AraC-like DNA-binding protein/uncharacterized Zn ribbon protein